DKIKYLQAIRGRTNSIGMNHDELSTVLLAVNKHLGLSSEVAEGKDAVSTYSNALKIMEAMGVERLHVHGQDLDIVLRKGAGGEEALDFERLGMAYAKYAVVTKLKKGTTDPNLEMTDNLKVEGLQQMMELATHLKNERGLSGREAISLLYTGYLYDPKGVSVVVSPSKWIYGAEQEAIQVTGAGDTVMANAFAYSGINLTMAEIKSVLEKLK
ncbi:MAG: hypothetical protein NTU61_00360, partial [Candidatus Altiarchaeota archaeon]|nr:hypothetical protein [Candidatus Altiarchaeota archaeon]